MADVLTKDQLFEHVAATVDKAVAEAVQEQIRKTQEAQATVIPSWFQAFEQKQAEKAATKDGDHIGRMLRSIAAGKGDPDRAIGMAKTWYDEPTYQTMKKTLTAWPKITGSDTFIIVALRCSDRSRPCCFASSICSAKKLRNGLMCMTELSRISPSSTAIFFLRTVTAPVAATNS